MKNILTFILIAAFCLAGGITEAQDTLPAFTVKNRSGKVILSWVNNYAIVKQMSIQRSADSLKGFKTILTLPDPSSITNGFLDNNAPNTEFFYKLYILLDSGKYIFSKSQKPQKELTQPVVNATVAEVVTAKAAEPKQAIKDSVTSGKKIAINSPVTAPAAPVPQPAPTEPPPKPYEIAVTKTSNKKHSDGLKSDTVNMVRPETYTPSGFVFTNPDGNITVVLPIGKKEQYKIKFFDGNGDEMFQVNNIKDRIIILDKSNFMRSGWYRFELYEDNVLKEKNKVMIPKEGSMR